MSTDNPTTNGDGSGTGEKKKGRFEPKYAVNLDPPKDDLISTEYLAKCDGLHEGFPTYVGIKGRVFDVTGNKAYGPEGGYKIFAGADASRALAMTSLKKEDVRPEWRDLPEEQHTILDDWYTYFSKRYNIVGVIEGADNM